MLPVMRHPHNTEMYVNTGPEKPNMFFSPFALSCDAIAGMYDISETCVIFTKIEGRRY